MFIVETYGLAVVLSIITMICWGSWPNTQKLTDKSWRFELFYWDYVLGIVLVSVVSALTLGSSGESGRPFLQDLMQADGNLLLSAVIGGVIFNAGNILFIAAITLTGMSVAFPIGAGLSMVIGIIVNYLAVPSGNPLFLFGGTLLVILAILFSASASRGHVHSKGKTSAKGIMLAIVAAVLFGFFYRFVAASMAADFTWPDSGKLTPYTAVVMFGAGVLLSNILFNTLLMKKPIEGQPVGYADYFKGSVKNHGFGVLGGVIWGLGLCLSILSSGKTGFAVSFGLGQGNAMIAAIWGVFVWKEFSGASPATGRKIWLMFACYVLGLALIILSKL